MNKPILLLRKNSEEKKRIQNLIRSTEADLEKARAKFFELCEILKKEFADVQKLEGNSITALFYNFLGTKVEQLDKERQEYLSAKLKYDACKNEISNLERELERLKSELILLGEPEIELKKLLDEKKRKLRQLSDSTCLKFEKLLNNQYAAKKEISEAILTGEKAMQGLMRAIDSLQNAQNWGTFDLLGGGILATAVKHSKIDEAKNDIEEVQHYLNQFRRELSDTTLNSGQNLAVEMDSFTGFADYFFDNLITDWIVQSKINQSLDACRKMFDQISVLMIRLRESDAETTIKYQNYEQELTTYLEQVE
jgi:DNA repair exonuclease SbcCD ATPase subunit